MGMFLNYQNIAKNYVPNNLVNAFPGCTNNSKLAPCDASKPFEEYDVTGKLTGYSWRYGDTLNLEFNIDGEITLEADAIILKTAGQTPTEDTLATIGQRAYNVVDLISWTCTGIYLGKYEWQKDKEFTYPVDATRSIYISAEDYLKDKNVEVTLYNFRMEPIYNKIFVGTSTIIFPVDKTLSMSLNRGIYYCSVVVFNEDVQYTIFDSTDCSLLVK